MTPLIIFGILWLLCGLFTVMLDKFISLATDTTALKYPVEMALAFAFGPLGLVFFIIFVSCELIIDSNFMKNYPSITAVAIFTIIASIISVIYHVWVA